MKKRITGVAALALSALIGGSVMTSACSFLSCEPDRTGYSYTITYTDENGLQTVKVFNGEKYEIEAPAARTGYKFLGYYDAETEGNRLTDEYGLSLDKYLFTENITVYPRWQANKYTVVLNYGEASGSVKSVEGVYGESLPELPTTVEYAHHDFKGWYTAENCGGVQIADSKGLNPIVSVVNADNFDIDKEYINLYAGFEITKYSVTLKFNNGKPDETVNVPYGTKVKDIVYTTRGEDGKAVLTWADSTSEAFTGAISGDITLTAAAWAPCINFDTDGGVALAPVVAVSGATVELPTPVKALNKFAGWQKDGAAYTDTTMPAQSITLKAKWQPQIDLDSNGGSKVEPVSVAVGGAITLPTPTREGYSFAGWYTADGEKYAETKMPAEGVALKAGWYKNEKQTLTVISASNKWYTFNKTPVFRQDDTYGKNIYSREIALGKITNGNSVTMKVTFKFKARAAQDSRAGNVVIDLYSRKEASSAYLLSQKTASYQSNTTFVDTVWEATITVSDNVYMCFYCPDSLKCVQITDMYCEVEYPDTSEMF